GGVEVSVRDDGSGVAPENVPKLFQPYFTTKTYGTGLGLFVTRKLVQEHGGAVTFESKVGEGTVFRVYLPNTDSVHSPGLWPGVATSPSRPKAGAISAGASEEDAP